MLGDDGDELVQCKNVPAHRVMKKRLAKHYVKCKDPVNDQPRLVTCDYNTTHKVAEVELQYHHQTCPDRPTIENQMTQSEQSKFPMPKLDNMAVEENWDAFNYPSYDPEAYAMNNEVLRHKDVAPPSELKNFRHSERAKFQELGKQPAAAPVKQPPAPQKGVVLPPHRDVTTLANELTRDIQEKLRVGQNQLYVQLQETQKPKGSQPPVWPNLPKRSQPPKEHQQSEEPQPPKGAQPSAWASLPKPPQEPQPEKGSQQPPVWPQLPKGPKPPRGPQPAQ